MTAQLISPRTNSLIYEILLNRDQVAKVEIEKGKAAKIADDLHEQLNGIGDWGDRESKRLNEANATINDCRLKIKNLTEQSEVLTKQYLREGKNVRLLADALFPLNNKQQDSYLEYLENIASSL